ncbi:MAG: hypothetical protein J3K34DRAFT_433923 [Monoraphidium minutum]|nr:MAG: hypothetical protein J3K34DRAFT_433923 [Monoraphidium minutum]
MYFTGVVIFFGVAVWAGSRVGARMGAALGVGTRGACARPANASHVHPRKQPRQAKDRGLRQAGLPQPRQRRTTPGGGSSFEEGRPPRRSLAGDATAPCGAWGQSRRRRRRLRARGSRGAGVRAGVRMQARGAQQCAVLAHGPGPNPRPPPSPHEQHTCRRPWL